MDVVDAGKPARSGHETHESIIDRIQVDVGSSGR
jgi:hypothetical protein